MFRSGTVIGMAGADAAKTADAPDVPEGGRLERSRAARRERVIAAVLELAAEGGYDAIQVRAIADRTGISSDTIYRYFGSRDRLIGEAVGQWSAREFYEPAPTWLDGETAAEQLLAYYRQVWGVWEANPRMLETYVRAAHVEGDLPGGIADTGISRLLPVTEYALRDVEPAYRADALMVVGHFTHSAMTYVVRGQLSVDEVYPRLERVVRRLAQHPAMAEHRPADWGWVPDGSE
jgi:AcrR family transcriptional regulator